MAKLNRVLVEIDATFGSDLQQQVGVRVLQTLLRLWIDDCHSRHSKNRIQFRVTDSVSGNEHAYPPIGS